MKLNLIPDKELENLENEDILGTYPYVETLHKVVTTCQTPFNIGVIGGWGTGKSSIIESLFKKLKGSKDFESFKFDAWKYSDDPFRRSLIVALIRKFELSEKKQLQELLYQKTIIEEPNKNRFKHSFLKLIWLAPILILVVYVSLAFLLNLRENLDEYTAVLTALSLITTVVMYFVQDLFVNAKVIRESDRVFSPEQFEEIFDEIVDSICKGKRSIWKWIREIVFGEESKKLVIVIDNIDRCNPETVVQVLLTVKNFLDKRNVIFILPIDEEGVKKFLANSTRDTSEFLRKIFNATIRLKKFSNAEMFDYTWKLVKKYGLEEMGINAVVVDMVCKEYTNNPRKIIQFLNNFQLELFTIREQGEREYIDADQVFQNLPFFAKINILKEEYPNLYNELFHKQFLLDQIHYSVANGRYQIDHDSIYKVDAKDVPQLSEEEWMFFKRTSFVQTPKTIEPFITNKDLRKDIPDDIASLVSSSNWERIKEHLIQEVFSFERLIQLMREINDKEIVKRELYESSGASFLGLVCDILDDEDFEPKYRDFYEKGYLDFLDSVFADKRFKINFDSFNTQKLLSAAKWYSIKEPNHLRNQIANSISFRGDNQDESFLLDYLKCLPGSESIIGISAVLKRLLEKSNSVVFSILDLPNPTYYFKRGDLFENLQKLDTQKQIKDQEFLVDLAQVVLEKRLIRKADEYTLYLIIGGLLQNSQDFQIVGRLQSILLIDLKLNVTSSPTFFANFSTVNVWLYNHYETGKIDDSILEVYENHLEIAGRCFIESKSHNDKYLSIVYQFFRHRRIEKVEFYCTSVLRKITSSERANEIVSGVLNICFEAGPVYDFEYEFLIDQILKHKIERNVKGYFISEVYKKFFREELDQTGFLEYMSKLKSDEESKELIKEKVEGLTNRNYQFKIIGLVNKLGDDFIGKLPSNMIVSSKNESEKIEVINKIKDSLTDPGKYLKEPIEKVASELLSSGAFNPTIFELVLDNQNVIDSSLVNSIVEILANYIGKENSLEQEVVSRILIKVEKKNIQAENIKSLKTKLKFGSQSNKSEVRDNFKKALEKLK